MSIDLNQFLVDSECKSSQKGVYLCAADRFESLLFNIQSTLGYIWLIDIVVTDEREKTGNFSVLYHFICVEKYEKFSIKVDVAENIKLKSIAHMWMNANIHEQEAYEKFGIQFTRNYNKIFFDEDENIFPMRKNCSQSPSMKNDVETHDLQLTLNNPFKYNKIFLNTNVAQNKVSLCKVDSGHFHQGVEKLMENVDFKNAFPILENTFNTSGVMWSFLLADCIEKSTGVTIPERAMALRMVFMELSRVLEHFRYINDLAVNLGAQGIYENTSLCLTRIKALMISYSGNENLHNTITPGGVMKDTAQVWLSRVADEISVLEKSLLNDYVSIKNGQNWKTSLGLSIGSKELATSWCSSGPFARALGINLDLRKLNPIYFYADVNFEVPIGTTGTAFDLLVVKIEEVFQSFKIIIQLLDNLPTGAISSEQLVTFGSMKREQIKFEDDEYRKKVNSFNHFSDINNSSFYEGHNGVLGLSIAQQEQKTMRMKLTSPSTINKVLFEKISLGNEVSSLTNLWCAMDINMSEVER